METSTNHKCKLPALAQVGTFYTCPNCGWRYRFFVETKGFKLKYGWRNIT
jgi:hypothetical protein